MMISEQMAGIACWLGNKLEARHHRTVERLELRRRVKGAAVTPIRTWERPCEGWQSRRYMELADEIVTEAQSCADAESGAAGPLSFVVVAHTLLRREFRHGFKLEPRSRSAAELVEAVGLNDDAVLAMWDENGAAAVMYGEASRLANELFLVAEPQREKLARALASAFLQGMAAARAR